MSLKMNSVISQTQLISTKLDYIKEIKTTTNLFKKLTKYKEKDSFPLLKNILNMNSMMIVRGDIMMICDINYINSIPSIIICNFVNIYI